MENYSPLGMLVFLAGSAINWWNHSFLKSFHTQLRRGQSYSARIQCAVHLVGEHVLVFRSVSKEKRQKKPLWIKLVPPLGPSSSKVPFLLKDPTLTALSWQCLLFGGKLSSQRVCVCVCVSNTTLCYSRILSLAANTSTLSVIHVDLPANVERGLLDSCPNLNPCISPAAFPITPTMGHPALTSQALVLAGGLLRSQCKCSYVGATLYADGIA